MRYRVYSGPRRIGRTCRLFAKQPQTAVQGIRRSLDDALSWARHLEQGGRSPLLIEGDDGTRLDRRAIVNALRVGMREQVD